MIKETQHCSFCEIEASISVPMIAGIDGYICEACVLLASQVVSSWGKKKVLTQMQQSLPKPAKKGNIDDNEILESKHNIVF